MSLTMLANKIRSSFIFPPFRLMSGLGTFDVRVRVHACAIHTPLPHVCTIHTHACSIHAPLPHVCTIHTPSINVCAIHTPLQHVTVMYYTYSTTTCMYYTYTTTTCMYNKYTCMLYTCTKKFPTLYY